MFLYSIVFPSLPLCSLFFSSFIPVLRACRLCFCSWWGFFFHLQRFMLHIVVSTPLPYRFPTVVGALCVCVCMYACRSFVFIRSVAPRFASSAAPITWWKVTQHGQMEALQRSALCKVATIPYIRKKDKKEIPFLTTIAHKHSQTHRNSIEYSTPSCELSARGLFYSLCWRLSTNGTALSRSPSPASNRTHSGRGPFRRSHVYNFQSENFLHRTACVPPCRPPHALPQATTRDVPADRLQFIVGRNGFLFCYSISIALACDCG